ncbi:DUF2064 domain-containing protein [Allosalinactinospora lopnorensis]|uniref:DUF2064 domain-containing protein n=1 Tax=Allosalinactinospora lopnorensis TaxID=1352348 RepID=UPI000623DCED|nr:DUF2064 domain-containing protein [Allosalinactinospora lopnorensis]
MAAVLITSRTGAAPPPGVDRGSFASALTEDSYEVLAGLELCESTVVAWDALPERADSLAAAAAEVVWPGTPVFRAGGSTSVRGALEKLTGHGAEQAVLVSADAPDLPPLLIGKLFRALGNAEVAVCPAESGGLVALAARLPFPEWPGEPDLDDPDVLGALTSARPERRALSTVPGWHRLRGPADISRLDPGLEGWENTRALLAGRTGPPPKSG